MQCDVMWCDVMYVSQSLLNQVCIPILYPNSISQFYITIIYPYKVIYPYKINKPWLLTMALRCCCNQLLRAWPSEVLGGGWFHHATHARRNVASHVLLEEPGRVRHVRHGQQRELVRCKKEHKENYARNLWKKPMEETYGILLSQEFDMWDLSIYPARHGNVDRKRMTNWQTMKFGFSTFTQTWSLRALVTHTVENKWHLMSTTS